MNGFELRSLDDLAVLIAMVREQVTRGLQQANSADPLSLWRQRIELQLPQAVEDTWFAESMAQAIVCCEWAIRTATQATGGTGSESPNRSAAAHPQNLQAYLRGRADLLFPAAESGWLAELVGRVRQADFGPLASQVEPAAAGDPLIHGFEQFLAAYDPQTRARSGVFYTPEPVVKFVIGGVDDSLRRDLGVSLGLADVSTGREVWQAVGGTDRHSKRWGDEPFVRILDPACGTGAFLVEVIGHIHHTLVESWQAAGHAARDVQRLWRSYVDRHLLSRLIGFEVMMAPWAIAHLRLAMVLAATGCRLEPDQPLRLYLTDTLADPAANELFQDAGSDSVVAAKSIEPVTVIVGNPPYAGISDNRNRWIKDLMRGRCEGEAGRRSYYHVDGQPLGEKKLWLADDYVKFLRYMQWRIERAGGGVAGFVTNHGYLDNPTFRGVRRSLLQSFSEITVVDLHGNVKKRERSPDGSADASVFSTEQGMAVSLFIRRPVADAGRPVCQVRRADLWGSGASKRETLALAAACGLATKQLAPVSPDYLFVSRDNTHRVEYEQGFRLPDVMPVATTAVVTARDRLVIALTDSELLQRMRVLRDGAIDDEQIRAEYFARPRSSKYAAGDTRGWKLSEARRRLQNDANWRDRICCCLYRPFDCRRIYWSDGMIDWPRTEVMRHLTGGSNLALIARRQMLPERECNFFWITDRITIDGVIRSDNRGSESVFPLFLVGTGEDGAGRRPNFSDEFVHAAGAALPDRPVASPPGSASAGGPAAWLGYIYAQFHSPCYRERYADLLRSDFPRVFLTRDAALWDDLSRLGCELIELHLGPGSATSGDGPSPPTLGATESVLTRRGSDAGWRGDLADDLGFVPDGPAKVEPGYPKYTTDGLWIGRGARFVGVPPEVWSHCVGGHQVCRKWLKDRRGRELSAAEIAHYSYIVTAIDRTRRLMTEIDRAIEERGGWPALAGGIG